MYISDLMQRISHKLQGCNVSQTELLGHMDGVIDDINTRMNTRFPTYTEAIKKIFISQTQFTPGFSPNTPGLSPNAQGVSPAMINIDYTYIPDKYQRSVVIVGAALKFYEADEEGNQSAQVFRENYNEALYFMIRDFSFNVPKEYQEDNQGFIGLSDEDTESPGMRVSNDPFNTNTRLW